MIGLSEQELSQQSMSPRCQGNRDGTNTTEIIQYCNPLFSIQKRQPLIVNNLFLMKESPNKTKIHKVLQEPQKTTLLFLVRKSNQILLMESIIYDTQIFTKPCFQLLLQIKQWRVCQLLIELKQQRCRCPGQNDFEFDIFSVFKNRFEPHKLTTPSLTTMVNSLNSDFTKIYPHRDYSNLKICTFTAVIKKDVGSQS